MDVQPWHSKQELTSRLQQFHECYARQPMAAIDGARLTHTTYTDYLANELRKLGMCSRVEYTGSAYEGVKVSNDIEFDIMLIKTCTTLTAVPTADKGYYYLQERGCTVSPETKVAEFCGTLQKLVNKHRDMSRLVLLRYHGPAIQMDVYKKDNNGMSDVWYSVDVVLSYEVKVQRQNRVFVAKPLKSDENGGHVINAWRMSYSLEEKSLFDGMDRDNGCRKKVLRILKVLRNREVGIHQLTSYHLKTALFYEMKDSRSWKQSELGLRLIGVLRRLFQAVDQCYQPHYFDPQINLLRAMQPTTATNIRDRLSRVLRTEHVFNSVTAGVNGVVALETSGRWCMLM